jgi:hypothetical protein
VRKTVYRDVSVFSFPPDLYLGLFCVFIYCLFSDAVSGSDYIVSNDRVINE